MSNFANLQHIKKTSISPFEVAMVYYRTIFALNGIKVTTRQLQLISFIATKGNLYTGGKRDLFCKTFNSSTNTTYNMVSHLISTGILKKENNTVEINPLIRLDFSKQVNLLIQLNYETPKQAQ